jgi:hypothetical protein
MLVIKPLAQSGGSGFGPNGCQAHKSHAHVGMNEHRVDDIFVEAPGGREALSILAARTPTCRQGSAGRRRAWRHCH